MPRPLVARGGAGWSWNTRYCSCCCFGGIFFGFSPPLPEKCFVLCNFELHSTAWRRVHRRLWNRPCSCLRPFPFAAATFPQRSKHKNKGSSCSQPSDRMRKGRKRLRTSVSQALSRLHGPFLSTVYLLRPWPILSRIFFGGKKISVLSSQVCVPFHNFPLRACRNDRLPALLLPFLPFPSPELNLYEARGGNTEFATVCFFGEIFSEAKIYVSYKCAKSRSLAKLFRFTFGECPASGARDCTLEIVA